LNISETDNSFKFSNSLTKDRGLLLDYINLNFEEWFNKFKLMIASYIIYENKFSDDLENIEKSLNPKDYIDKIKKSKSDYEKNLNPIFNNINGNLDKQILKQNENNKNLNLTKIGIDIDILSEIQEESETFIKLILKLEILFFLKNRLFDLLKYFSELFLVDLKTKSEIIASYLNNNGDDFNLLYHCDFLLSLGIFYLLSLAFKNKTEEIKYLNKFFQLF